MGGIFINYRRNPGRNGFVSALRDRLVDEFGEGQVFLDERSIDLGDEYPDVLRARLLDADVVVAVIHPGWVADLRATGRDWVREELELALRHGKHVVPLWLDGVRDEEFPALPEVLRLARRQAFRMSGTAWTEADFTAFVVELRHFVRPTWKPDEPANLATTPPRRWAGPVALLLAAPVFAAPLVFPLEDGDGLDLAIWSLLLMPAPPMAAVLMLLARRPVRAVERNVHDMPLRQYYARIAAPLGIMIVLLTVTAITAGEPSPDVVPLLVFVVIVATVYLVNLIRTQQKDALLRDEQWPQRLPEPVRPAPVRGELARFERRVTGWPAYRATRELRDRADWHAVHLRRAAEVLSEDGARGRWRWLTADHPVVLAAYGMWVAGTLGLLAGVSVRALLAGAAIASALAVVTLEATYRHQRWQRAAVAAETEAHTDEVTAKLAELRGRRR